MFVFCSKVNSVKVMVVKIVVLDIEGDSGWVYVINGWK